MPIDFGWVGGGCMLHCLQWIVCWILNIVESFQLLLGLGLHKDD